MCDPVSASIALAVAGSAAKYAGDRASQSARERTFQAERLRQQGLENQQTAQFQDSLDKAKAVVTPEAQNAAAQAREGTLAHAIVPASATNGAYLPGSSSAPSVVATASDKAAATGQQTSLGLAHALAALGGTGDQLQALNTGIGRNSERIGQLGGYRAGSAGVLDSEMTAASHKGDFLNGIGGLAQQIGMASLGGGGGLKASAARTIRANPSIF